MATRRRKQADIDRAARAKYSRLARAGVPKELLPTLPDLTGDTARAFINRGNDRYRFVQDVNGEWLSRKELNALRSQTRKAQREANRIIAGVNARYGNERFNVTGDSGTYRTVADDSPVERRRAYTRDVGKISSFRDLRKYYDRVAGITKEYFEENDEQWKENFITAVEDAYGQEGGAPLIELVQNMSTEEFVYTMITNDVSIEFVYTSTELEDSLMEMIEIFERGELEFSERT